MESKRHYLPCIAVFLYKARRPRTSLVPVV